MKMLNRKFFAALVLVMILALSFTQLLTGYAAETPAKVEEVLVFLEDVVQLDMTKYSATLSTIFVRYHDWLGGLAQTNGIYTLEYTSAEGTSILEVAFTFVETKLTSCFLYVKQGSPHYSQLLADNLNDAAAVFLQRYQTFTGDSELEKMSSVLNTMDVTKETTKTNDDVKLEVSVSSNATLLSWRKTYNNADYCRLNVEFRDGKFFMFNDDRSYYTIGGTEVNISEEEAINIALNRVENFAYLYQDKEIADFNIVKEQIRAELHVLNRYKPLELYPCWMIDLPLDRIYPGSVYYIRVMLWADTGEVISCKALGYGGGEEEISPVDSANEPLATSYVAVGVAAILASIAITLTILKKRSK